MNAKTLFEALRNRLPEVPEVKVIDNKIVIEFKMSSKFDCRGHNDFIKSFNELISKENESVNLVDVKNFVSESEDLYNEICKILDDEKNSFNNASDIEVCACEFSAEFYNGFILVGFSKKIVIKPIFK